MSDIRKKLVAVQNELNCPKSHFNSFGKYSYRSCEDILQSVKPVAKKHGSVVYCSDEVKQIGERFYVVATATFADCDSGETISVSAWAREEDEKKGTAAPQITGSSSSYARKYALSALLALDDSADPDTDPEDAEAKRAEIVGICKHSAKPRSLDQIQAFALAWSAKVKGRETAFSDMDFNTLVELKLELINRMQAELSNELENGRIKQ